MKVKQQRMTICGDIQLMRGFIVTNFKTYHRLKLKNRLQNCYPRVKYFKEQSSLFHRVEKLHILIRSNFALKKIEKYNWKSK